MMTKKPLPRGNLSGAYIVPTSAFHQFGIGVGLALSEEIKNYFLSLPEKQLRDTCVWRVNDKYFGCYSRWRGRRIYAKRKLCGGGPQG